LPDESLTKTGPVPAVAVAVGVIVVPTVGVWVGVPLGVAALLALGVLVGNGVPTTVTEPVETEGTTPDGGYNRDRTHWKNVEPYVGVAPHANRVKL